MTMMEKDLFGPIKEYFESFGYTCDGEVKDIDLYMEKDGASVAVELKKSLDFKAVRQAALRQKVTDTVFIAIFRPSNMRAHAFRDSLYLLKRLGIGLITLAPRTGVIEIVNEPVVSELSLYLRRNGAQKKELAAEFRRRRIKTTIGGVTHTQVLTGYRQEALLVLHGLKCLGGECKASDLRRETGIERARQIVYDNHYGWFERAGHGIYRITDAGYDALSAYADVLGELLKT
ncbi:MAG: hypothetical protein E7300_03070 [Lachnospiraceae bacterium]|nr:hypothetical protein [Lachnospiraceae bacterium]